MNNTTSLGIVTGVIVYFALLFLFFSQSPPELLYGHAMTGVQLNKYQTINSTAVSDQVSAVTMFADFTTFDIEGIPIWLTIIAVYIPALMLVLGIYGLIRGI